MTRMASPDRYAPRTCWITVSRLGSVSATSAGPSSSSVAHRNMSEDLQFRRPGLPRQQILHTNLPLAGRIVQSYGYKFAGAASRRQQISGVIADGLSGWVHKVDM